MTFKKDPEAQIKQTLALELSVKGLSYDEIAQQVGYVNGDTVRRTIDRMMQKYRSPLAEQKRTIQDMRIESDISICNTIIEENKAKPFTVLHALDRKAKLYERQAKLLALDKPIENPNSAADQLISLLESVIVEQKDTNDSTPDTSEE